MNKDERAALGPEIRSERERLGLTQVELAEAADVNPRTLRNIEVGHTVGQPDVILRLRAALTRFAHAKRRQAEGDLSAIQGRFSERASDYYKDADTLNAALIALVEMQTNLLRGDYEAVRANTADFFLPTLFILNDLAGKAGATSQDWQPALRSIPDSEIAQMADRQAKRKRDKGVSREDEPAPPLDAAAHSTGEPSAKERMIADQDDAAERQDSV